MQQKEVYIPTKVCEQPEKVVISIERVGQWAGFILEISSDAFQRNIKAVSNGGSVTSSGLIDRPLPVDLSAREKNHVPDRVHKGSEAIHFLFRNLTAYLLQMANLLVRRVRRVTR
jgi:hypothetical protein